MQKTNVLIKRIYVLSKKADPSPPLGTILGNVGVNTVNFCNQFNAYTTNLPAYFKVSVCIIIFDNRTFTFTLKLPSIGYILNLLRFERIIKIRVDDRIKDKTIFCVKLYQLLKLTKLKLGRCDSRNFKTLVGTVKSHGLIIVR